jgi:hypothetical protein
MCQAPLRALKDSIPDFTSELRVAAGTQEALRRLPSSMP